MAAMSLHKSGLIAFRSPSIGRHEVDYDKLWIVEQARQRSRFPRQTARDDEGRFVVERVCASCTAREKHSLVRVRASGGRTANANIKPGYSPLPAVEMSGEDKVEIVFLIFTGVFSTVRKQNLQA